MSDRVREEEYVAAHFENLAEQNPARYTARWAWAVHRVGSAFRERGDVDEWVAHWELIANTLRARVDAGVASDEESHDLPAHVANLASAALQIGNLDAAHHAVQEAQVRWTCLPEHLRYSHPATRTTSILWSRTASAMAARTVARCSSVLWPWKARPMCQSEVRRILMLASVAVVCDAS